MTIDDVAAAMRERFTTSRGAPVQLTAEEWNTLAGVIYLRDAMELIALAPDLDRVHTAAVRALDRCGGPRR